MVPAGVSLQLQVHNSVLPGAVELLGYSAVGNIYRGHPVAAPETSAALRRADPDGFDTPIRGIEESRGEVSAALH